MLLASSNFLNLNFRVKNGKVLLTARLLRLTRPVRKEFKGIWTFIYLMIVLDKMMTSELLTLLLIPHCPSKNKLFYFP